MDQKTDLEERINFMRLGAEDLAELERLRPVLEAHADNIISSFHQHLLSFEATRNLLSSSETRDRLLALQRDYLLSLTEPEIDEAYVEQRLRVGRTHERIRLAPRWVLGACSRYLTLLVPIVLDAGAGQRALQALTRRLFLDAQLLTEGYVRAREESLAFSNRELSECQRQLSRDLEELDRVLQETTRRAQTAERLASTATIAAGLAHEVGSPMNVILGHAEMIERATTNDRIRERAHVIVDQVTRVTQLVQTLLDVARPRDRQQVPVSLSRILNKALEFVHQRLEQRGISVERNTATVPDVSGNPDQLEQVFLNLILNAIDAMPEGGTLRIQLERGAEGWVCATVADSGTGIPAELLSRVFDPFFTTKAKGHGSGLGLFVVRTILGNHGGSIDVSSEVGRGTEFQVLLPSASPVGGGSGGAGSDSAPGHPAPGDAPAGSPAT